MTSTGAVVALAAFNVMPILVSSILGGIALVAGRFIHARGLLTGNLRYRVLGMQLTFLVLAILAVLNVIVFGLNLF